MHTYIHTYIHKYRQTYIQYIYIYTHLSLSIYIYTYAYAESLEHPIAVGLLQGLVVVNPDPIVIGLVERLIEGMVADWTRRCRFGRGRASPC